MRQDFVRRASCERKAVVGRDAADAARNARTIQQNSTALKRSSTPKAIDLDSYERPRGGVAPFTVVCGVAMTAGAI